MILIPESANYATFVISAQSDKRDADTNCRYHAALTGHLAKELAAGHVFAVLQCLGKYKGIEERSIAVVAPREWHDEADWLCKQYGQESILQIYPSGRGRLRYRDGKRETIGEYATLSAGTADDYTEVLGTGHCFTFI